MKYINYFLIILLTIPLLLYSSPQGRSKLIDADRTGSIISRVLVGKGAKVIVDTKANAKFIYDDMVLASSSKYISLADEELESDQTADSEDNIGTREVAGLPTELTISKAYPNPFNPVVSISYGLPTSSDVNILIYDLIGNKVMEYSFEGQSSGWHEFKWNAVDLNGQSIGSGIYLMAIRAGDMIEKQKITYLK